MISLIRRTPLILLAILILTDCSPLFRRREIDLTQISPEQVLRRLDENLHRLKTLEGWAKVTLESSERPYDGFCKVILKAPDSLVVKFKALFGMNVALLSINGENFKIYSPKENTLYWGKVNEVNLEEVLGVNLSFQELREVFTGVSSLQEEDPSLLSDFFPQGDKIILIFEDDQGIRRYWVDPWDFTVVRSERLDRGGNLYFIEKYSRFKRQKGILLPRMIRVIKPMEGERLTVYYERQRINKGLREDHFQLKIPQSAQWVRIKRY